MSYKFIQNIECEFFPCHKFENIKDFNCLFCYCPLYMLGENCGGKYSYIENNIKDCSSCTIPHIKEVGYSHIQNKMLEVIEIVKLKK